MHRRPFAISLLTLALLTPSLHAATPATLVGGDLQPRRVNLQSLDPEGVSYFDANRHYTSVRLGEIFQLRAIGQETAAPAAPAESSRAQLVDGQMVVGTPAGISDDGQALRWSHPLLGALLLPIDQLRSLTFSGAPLVAEGSDDVVELKNGDRVNGFISAIDHDGVHVRPAGQREAVALPLERVRAIAFANVATEPSSMRHRVGLADGSRVYVSSVSMQSDRFALRPTLRGGHEEVTLGPEDVAQIEFATTSGRLESLARLPMTRVSGDVFGVVFEPRIEGHDVLLHAPAVVRFELPQGAERFSAQAELDVPADDVERALAWADFEVVLKVEGVEAGRWRINGAQPSARINVRLEGRALTLELDPGVNGPIMDRLRLTEAVVLVRPIE